MSADDEDLSSVSSLEDLLSSAVAADTTTFLDNSSIHEEQDNALNTPDSKSSSNESGVHIHGPSSAEDILIPDDPAARATTPTEDIFDVPVFASDSSPSLDPPRDELFKGWDESPPLPNSETPEVIIDNESEEILSKGTPARTSEEDGAELRIRDESNIGGTVQELNPQQQQQQQQQQPNPLKMWNNIVRQNTPKGGLWKGVNRWKNSIGSAQNSPSRQKKRGARSVDTEQDEEHLSASVTCEETELAEDGATCEEDEDGLLVQFKKRVEKDLLQPKLEKAKSLTMDPLNNNPKGFNFGQVPALFSNRNSETRDATGEFFKIKPYGIYPTEYNMNESELYYDMLRESESFVKVESRSKDRQIGTLKVEVLSCMGIPKFDRFSKPNAIAYLVCGDTAFATDYIVSSLSPLWPARSRRAAEFPLFHAFAKVYLGVFNATDKDVDDYAGRAVINVASLRHGVQYDVNLPLKASTMVYDQRPRGVVRVRFSLHWSDERAAVLSYLPWNKSDLPWVNDPSRAQFMSIPCAETKTFRNVACEYSVCQGTVVILKCFDSIFTDFYVQYSYGIDTVHGQDLPGKFSRRAFR